MNNERLEMETVKLLQDDLMLNVQYGESIAFSKAMTNICQLTGAQSALIFSLIHDLANDEVRLTLNAQLNSETQRFRFIIKNSLRESLSINHLFIEPKNGTRGSFKDLVAALAECKDHLTQDEHCHSSDEFQQTLLTLEKASHGTCNAFVYSQRTTGWLCLFSDLPVDDIIDKHLVLHNTLALSLAFTAHNIDQQNQINTFQQVINLMPQRVFWKNRRSIYLGANQAFATDANFESPKDLIGVTDYAIFPEQAELFRSDDAEAMNTGVHLINSEEPQKHSDGKTIWLRTSKRPITSVDNKIIGIVGTYDEITELKHTQAQLLESKNELERRVIERTNALNSTLLELERTKDQMVESEKMAALGGLVSGVAHEINTPIGISITSASHISDLVNKMTADMDRGGLTKSNFSDYCSKLSQSSQLVSENLNRASNQIVNFKRVAVDQSSDIQRITNFNEYIHAILNTIIPAHHEIKIHTDLKINKDINALVFPGALSQIIKNLTENAISHGFDGRDEGKISITCEQKERLIKLKFTDNGNGIEPSNLDKVFDPFYTTKRGSGRSGLGLNIIYNLVTQKLKGTIRCDSTIDEGSSFYIEFRV